MQEKEKESPPHHPLLLDILAQEVKVNAEDIVDFELNVCDTQDGVIGGDPLHPPHFLGSSLTFWVLRSRVIEPPMQSRVYHV